MCPLCSSVLIIHYHITIFLAGDLRQSFRMQQSRKPKQWTHLEQIRYHFFLLLHLDRFRNSSKKNSNIFKEMQLFLHTKNADKCRSHHQKRAERRDIVQVLRNFYHNYYEIRLLDGEHLMMEVRQYLTKTNPAFITNNMHRFDLPALLEVFERNLQVVLQVERRDQEMQTEETKDKEEGEREKPVMVEQITQAVEFHLIVENCNNDIWPQL